MLADVHAEHPNRDYKNLAGSTSNRKPAGYRSRFEISTNTASPLGESNIRPCRQSFIEAVAEWI
jgi:hypothetical protein